MNVDEIPNRITLIKARLYELSEQDKEKVPLREEMIILIGELRGHEAARVEFDKTLDQKIEEGMRKVLDARKVTKKRAPKKAKVDGQKPEVIP